MKTVKRNVSFHNFLLEKKDLLQKWLHALTIPEFVPTKSLLVCSEHFESRCFEKLLTIVGRLPCDAAHIDMQIRLFLLEHGFYFVKSKEKRISKDEARAFYAEHSGRFFYDRLVASMSSGPLAVHVLARQKAISHLRSLIGPTKVYKAVYEAPQSLRAQYGISDTRNAIHASDSEASVRREIAFHLPEFNINEWFAKCEPFFSRNAVTLDSTTWEHCPIYTVTAGATLAEK